MPSKQALQPLSPGAASRPLRFLDFFAGSGLVTEALKGCFDAVWANDVSEKKAVVYRANHDPRHFHLRDIAEIRGDGLPEAELSWASFPCQDLSLAGGLTGIEGARSGLVWQWLRVMGEAGARRPKVLALENVVGLVAAEKGAHYRSLHRRLGELGYKAGAMVLDAVRWLPQSRPRVFVVAVPRTASTAAFEGDGPSWLHPKSVVTAAQGLQDWVWWSLPEPRSRETVLADLIEWDAPVADAPRTERTLALIPPDHMARWREEAGRGLRVAPGYKRTRARQVLELRFDGIAGCLRTPKGGSSRQTLLLQREAGLATRLLTIREAARLMGAPESYRFPGGYNDAYAAIGDAVAVPPVRFLGLELLRPLADSLQT